MVANASALMPRRDVKVIGLISTAHFFSHFYMLLLPPLFLVLKDVYGVGFTELGLAIAVFSITTAITQAPMGFLVDRYGARNILIAGVFLESLAIALLGVFPFYGALIALMIVAGLANSVYHPADYAILNASVNQARMGRAFSIHTFAGYLGDALAPVTILFLVSISSWSTGLIVCGIGGAVIAVLMALNSAVLLDNPLATQHDKTPSKSVRSGLGLLFSLPILMGLLFFVGIAISGHGIKSFGVSTLNLRNGLSLEAAGLLLSAFLFAAPAGVLAGGWLADRVRRHDIVAALCFVIIAAAIFTVAAVQLPVFVIAVLFVIAGFCSGFVAPSRDMMIRSVTPPGQMGKVFGFVSTGFNIGGIVAPILYGYLLDNTDPGWVFWIVGIVSLLTVFTVLETGRRGRNSL